MCCSGFIPLANISLEAGLWGLGFLSWGEIDRECQGLGRHPEIREQDTNLSSTGRINVIGAPFVTAKAVCLKGSQLSMISALLLFSKPILFMNYP